MRNLMRLILVLACGAGSIGCASRTNRNAIFGEDKVGNSAFAEGFELGRSKATRDAYAALQAPRTTPTPHVSSLLNGTREVEVQLPTEGEDGTNYTQRKVRLRVVSGPALGSSN